MTTATMHVCERCGTEFAPHPNKPGRYCSHDCRNEAYKLTIRPLKDTRKAEPAVPSEPEPAEGETKTLTLRERLKAKHGWVVEKPVIVPSETKPARAKPMTPSEFTTALAAIEAQRIAAGLPLTDETMLACAEKDGREQAAMALEASEINGEARKGAYVHSASLLGKPRVTGDLSASEGER